MCRGALDARLRGLDAEERAEIRRADLEAYSQDGHGGACYVRTTRRGQIVEVIDETDARRRGIIPIPDDEIAAMRRMNRKERRSWASRERKKRCVK